MCGRILLLSDTELAHAIDALRAHAQLELDIDPDSMDQRSQARPGSPVFAIAVHDGKFALEELVWGYRPSWSTGPIFNTRIEQAGRQDGMWASSFQTGRCILPVAAFFEPDAARHPYLFCAPGRASLMLASLTNGRELSIVTTAPNADVAPIHQRMPLVLDAAETPRWFAGQLETLADRSALHLAVRPESDAAQGQQALF